MKIKNLNFRLKIKRFNQIAIGLVYLLFQLD